MGIPQEVKVNLFDVSILLKKEKEKKRGKRELKYKNILGNFFKEHSYSAVTDMHLFLCVK